MLPPLHGGYRASRIGARLGWRRVEDLPKPPPGPGGGSRQLEPPQSPRPPYNAPETWPLYVPHEHEWIELRILAAPVLERCMRCGEARR